MWSILRCCGLVIFASVFVIRASDAHAERPDGEDFASIRAWVESQPRTFENEVLFTAKDGQIVRSERFTTAGAIFGDFDGDDDIDLLDYNAFQICLSFSGPLFTIPLPCFVFDSDADLDIDQFDVAAFQNAFTGSIGGVRVEAGSLFPALASPDGYYSGEPGEWGTNSLRGIARQGGYTQDDLWYAWSVIARPDASGEVVIANSALPATAYTVLPPFALGEYRFLLTATNLITLEFASDITSLHVVECQTDAHCDDGIPCTADVCDLEGDTCEHRDACPPGQACNVDSGLCEPYPPCRLNADCQDGLFCNGAEVCAEGTCLAGPDPCAPDEVCGEQLDACLSPPGCINFTLNSDNLVGTTRNDFFCAPLIFNPGSGTLIASFQTGDSAEGLGGFDALNATFNAASTVVPIGISGIETINVSQVGGGVLTLSAANITGASVFCSVNSIGDIAISGIREPVGFCLSGVNDATVDFSLTFSEASLTIGPSDVINGTVSGAVAGMVTILTAAANGFETLSLLSDGNSPNRIATITQTTGNTLHTCKVSGSQNLALNTLPTTVRIYDASGMIGNLTLGSGTRADATSTYATFAAVDILRITGGSGIDTFIFGTSLDSSDADQSGESINGGTGDDVLQATFSSALGSPLPLSAIEELRVNSTANGSSFSLLNVSGVNKVTVESDDTANTLTVDNAVVTSTTQTWPELAFRGDGTAAAQTYDTITYNAFGASASTGDKLTVSFANRATALNATGTTNAHSTASLTVGGSASNGIETLTINASDGPLSVAGATNVWNLNTLTVTGSSNVTLTTITSNADNITSVTASGVTGHFTATIDAMNGGTILLGSGNDTVDITGSAAAATTMQGGAGNDILTGAGGVDNMQGGAGSDTLTGAAGADTLNGGNDNDTIQGDAGNDTITTGNGADTVVLTTTGTDTVSDFTAGAGGDQFEMDLSGLEAATGVDSDAASPGGAEVTDFTELNDGTSVADTNAISIQEIAIAAGATVVAADVNVIVIIGTVATTGALETLLEAGGGAPLTIHADGGDVGSSFPVMYSDGTNAFLAVCFAEAESVSDTDFEATDLTCVNLAQQSGNAAITAGEFVAANFDFVP